MCWGGLQKSRKLCKKFNIELLKDNQMAQMMVQQLIDYFQQDTNNPASTQTAIKDYKTENNILLEWSDCMKQ